MQAKVEVCCGARASCGVGLSKQRTHTRGFATGEMVSLRDCREGLQIACNCLCTREPRPCTRQPPSRRFPYPCTHGRWSLLSGKWILECVQGPLPLPDAAKPHGCALQNNLPGRGLLPFSPIKSTTETNNAPHQPNPLSTFPGLVATHSTPPSSTVPPTGGSTIPSTTQSPTTVQGYLYRSTRTPSFVNLLHVRSTTRVRQPPKLQQSCPHLSTVSPPRWPPPPSPTTTLPPPRRALALNSPPQPRTRLCVRAPLRAGDFTLETSRTRPPRGS
jgi:hypothetical protein